MLFIPQKPIHLINAPKHKIILTTQTHIIFTNLQFIEEYLALSLPETNPLLLEYAHQPSQALVATPDSIQIYWTDWQHQIHLRLFVCLYKEPLYSVEYNGGWRAFGDFQQYSPRQIRLWKTENAAEQYQSCFLGHLQYVVSSKHLVIFDHLCRKRSDIQWKDSQEYITRIQKDTLQLKAFRLNENTVLLQADSILLYIKQNIVLKVLSHPGVLSVTSPVFAWQNLSKIRLYSIEQDAINFHGECQAFDGQYYGAIIQQNMIMMLFYEFKELKVKSIRLVSEEQNTNYCKEQQEKRKFRHRYNENLQTFEKLRQRAIQSDTIPQPQHQIKSATFKINGKTIQQALKESIGKFKEQFDKFHQEEKFTQNHLQNCPSIPVETVEALKPAYYQMVDYKSDEDNKGSFGGQQASREQKYEQKQDNSVHTNNNIHLSSVLSNTSHQHEVVETPGFRILERSNDQWNYHSWVEQPKTEVMNPIVEQIDLQQPQSPDCLNPVQQTDYEGQSLVDIEILETNLKEEGNNKISSEVPNPIVEQQVFNSHKLMGRPQYCKQLNEQYNLKKGMQDPSASFVSNRSSRRKRILSSFVGGSQNNSNPSSSLGLSGNAGCQPAILELIPTNQGNTQLFSNLDQGKEGGIQELTPLNNLLSSQPEQQFLFNRSKVLKPVIQQEHKKYTQILTEIYRNQPQKFQEILQKHIGDVLQEKEARLFFAEHIRNFNSDMTKDKLIRLYSSIQDNQPNRILMTEALSEFRLDEVPSPCLCFQANFIDIFRLMYPKVYIEDLLQPSSRLVEDLIRNYFGKNFVDQKIIIQGVKIELQYPRNLLNILLYLNEWLKQPLQTLFQLYTKHLLKHNCSEVISKIVQSHIPQLCSIHINIFEDAAEKALQQLLEQKIIDYTVAEKILPFFPTHKKIIYNEIINLSEQFNVRGIVFDIRRLMNLPSSKDNLGFLQDIIVCNSCSVLSQLTLPSVLGQLNKIGEGKAKSHYTNEGIEITKMLSEKLIKNGYITQGFYNLSTVAAVLKRSYIAALLFKYCNGIYANRLANARIYTNKDFISLLKQLVFKGTRTPDPMPQHVFSHSGARKSWIQFNQISVGLIKNHSWELRFLIYTDIELASELIEQQIINKAELQACCKVLGYFLTPPKKMFASHKVQQGLVKLGSQSVASNQSGELFLVVKESRKRQARQKSSLRGSESKEYQDHLSKSLFASEEDTDPVLFDIKFSVLPDQSIHILREYYQESPIEEFFDALKLVDHQKIGIKQESISKFKAIFYQQLQYHYKSLVPFEYFFDKAEAWKKTISYLYQLEIQEFWVTYLLVDLLYGTGTEVVQVLINKIIKYFKDDVWSQSLQIIIEQFELSKPFLLKATAEAQERGLITIQAVLENKLLSI